MKEMFGFLIGIAVAIIIVGGAALPLLYSPTLDTHNSATNATTYGINNTNTSTIGYNLISLDSAGSSWLLVTADGIGVDTSNVTVYLNTHSLGNLTRAAAATTTNLTVTGSWLVAAGPNNLTFNASANSKTGNITTTTLVYSTLPINNNWNSAVNTFYAVLLAIVLIAALIIMILR